MIPANTQSQFIVFGAMNTFMYTNHRGERLLKTFIPLTLRYGTGPAYPTDRWLLEVFDVGKNAYRTYELANLEITKSNPQHETWGCANASNRETKPEPEANRPQ